MRPTMEPGRRCSSSNTPLCVHMYKDITHAAGGAIRRLHAPSPNRPPQPYMHGSGLQRGRPRPGRPYRWAGGPAGRYDPSVSVEARIAAALQVGPTSTVVKRCQQEQHMGASGQAHPLRQHQQHHHHPYIKTKEQRLRGQGQTRTTRTGTALATQTQRPPRPGGRSAVPPTKGKRSKAPRSARDHPQRAGLPRTSTSPPHPAGIRAHTLAPPPTRKSRPRQPLAHRPQGRRPPPAPLPSRATPSHGRVRRVDGLVASPSTIRHTAAARRKTGVSRVEIDGTVQHPWGRAEARSRPCSLTQRMPAGCSHSHGH